MAAFIAAALGFAFAAGGPLRARFEAELLKLRVVAIVGRAVVVVMGVARVTRIVSWPKSAERELDEAIFVCCIWHSDV